MVSQGGANDCIHRCISIEKRILDKTHYGMLGLSSDDEDDAAPRGVDDNLFGEEAKSVVQTPHLCMTWMWDAV